MWRFMLFEVKKENENRIKIKEKIRVRTFEKNVCEKDVASEKAFGGGAWP